ncbi:hypothetical protein [Streptomyces sp. XD-27]|uniref:hypothetical protein n=1 Tax=Streptomyces sp. XD-27 TaxID=3062779 RepID=UPI0026F441E0|nr:hypothetical protein [Streptomyces sp. XD-27]WKX71644.1 hypothetical protein Q3Y56_18520 [Streptomyces sp. XD-27]
MVTFLTVVVILVAIVLGMLLIHRLNAQAAGRAEGFRHRWLGGRSGAPRPGRRRPRM